MNKTRPASIGASSDFAGIDTRPMSGLKRPTCEDMFSPQVGTSAPSCRLTDQANTPAVSCMRVDTSPNWCRVSPKLMSNCVNFLK